VILAVRVQLRAGHIEAERDLEADVVGDGIGGLGDEFERLVVVDRRRPRALVAL